MAFLAPALCAVALAGCTASSARDQRGDDDATELARALEGRTPGPAQRCIQLTQTDGPTIAGRSILYRSGGRLWRNDPVGGCPSLAGDPIVIVEVFGGQLCENDRFRTVIRQTTIPGPYCRFGRFVPYVKAK